jgi:hypothetical protein
VQSIIWVCLPFLDLTRCFLDPTVSDVRNSSLLLRFTRPSKVFERFSNRRPSTSLSAFSAAKKHRVGRTNRETRAKASSSINRETLFCWIELYSAVKQVSTQPAKKPAVGVKDLSGTGACDVCGTRLMIDWFRLVRPRCRGRGQDQLVHLIMAR